MIEMTGVRTELPESDMDSSSLELTSNKRITDECVKKQGSNQKGTIEYKYKIYTFLIISLLQIFLNYDNGVIPVILNWIQEPYKFTSTELGIMGSLSYFAYVPMSFFMPPIFLNLSCHKAIYIGLFLNLLSLALFGLSVSKYIFFVAKFCIGASQSLFTTYYPLWVDTFAPPKHRNLWMSILQGGIIVGMAVGYVATSLFSFIGENGWRFSILTQIVFEAVLIILFLFLPAEFVNFDASRDDIVNFDLCTCENQEMAKPDLNGSKLAVISENDDNSPVSNYILSNRKESGAVIHNENTQSNAKKDLKYKDKTDKNVDVVSKDSNIGDTISYLNRLASSNFEYNLKRCRSLNIISSKNSISNYVEVSRIYSNVESSTINKFEYSKCSKCFLNNVKLYNEIVQIKKLSPWSKFKILIKHSIFILSCLSISALYFQVTGIHYWVTKMAVSCLKVKEKVFHVIFVIEMVTGPVLGILSGSHLIDQIIHHYPQYPLLVDTTIIIWASLTCVASTLLIFNQNMMAFVICIFVIIFLGSAIVPTVTLLSVAYVPHRLKPIAASFFMCQYHILGFTLGTIVPGAAVDIFRSNTAGLLIIFIGGYLGLIAYFLILYIKWKNLRTEQLKELCFYE
ncbi:integral membrane protein [Theileria orientalis strain Shintoku]|uniref:Integral membrane protein n=1 Tax=Theileria orientalis strain Shintoku TaxID=869250 RepID=J4C3Y6_THEOR|nr:integral membrane protein [Theileria orientalis strain Shintoku]BAM41251.1 integral membrane protein [Theileria orientalis strain Shintoku]|eukprot:XP_009691552.1 integral membrane protein [Theileria orientalis strain Shintoku]